MAEEPIPLSMPEELSSRARALLLEDGFVPVPTRDAATVALLRDGPDGLETFLMRRVATMAFAAGHHVFPGGRVDDSDAADMPWIDRVGDAELARRTSSSPVVARALVVAGVRETFEECGVLLACSEDGGPLAPDPAGWEQGRQDVLERRTSFGEFLRSIGAAVAPALVPSWDHWITPAIEPRRYDTRFFIAALPEGQHASSSSGESDVVVWVDPREAVRRHREGGFDMLPPTVAVLSAVAGFATVADVLAAAPGRRIRPLLPTAVATEHDVAWHVIDANTGELVATGEGS